MTTALDLAPTAAAKEVAAAIAVLGVARVRSYVSGDSLKALQAECASILHGAAVGRRTIGTTGRE